MRDVGRRDIERGVPGRFEQREFDGVAATGMVAGEVRAERGESVPGTGRRRTS
ncbi:hypothetical protein [Streptomyces sp. NPDC005244]|uniref:hypothetical protein n=1 Tax=Streptomyces sp. NPDC005244 TaxID=3364708 RepID=UPI00369E786E